jgi:hypothetical protein
MEATGRVMSYAPNYNARMTPELRRVQIFSDEHRPTLFLSTMHMRQQQGRERQGVAVIKKHGSIGLTGPRYGQH